MLVSKHNGLHVVLELNGVKLGLSNIVLRGRVRKGRLMIVNKKFALCLTNFDRDCSLLIVYDFIDNIWEEAIFCLISSQIATSLNFAY